MSNKIQDEESVLLYLSSEHSTHKSDDGHRFTVNIGNTTFVEKASGITPCKIIIGNLFPNVNEYRNSISIAGTPYTWPVGQYTASELVTAVTTAITPEDATLTYTNDRFVLALTASLKTFSATKDVWDMLGWDWRQLPISATPGEYFFVIFPNFPVTAPYPPSMFGERLVHISCDRLAHGNLIHGSDGKLYDVMATIPLGDVPYGSSKVWEPADAILYDVDYKYTNSLSSSLDFQLFDSKMRPLPYPLNHHVQMVLKVYHKEHRS